MAYKGHLSKGSLFRANGACFKIIGFDEATGDPRCRQIGDADVVETFSYADVVSAPDFENLDLPNTRLSANWDIADLDSAALRQASARLAELREAKTGYRSGDPASPAEGEPRPQYDPSSTKVTQRMKTKAAELGVAVSTLHAWWANYERFGLPGLVDGRMLRKVDALGKLDPQVKQVMLDVIAAGNGKARVPVTALHREVVAAISRNPDIDDEDIPSERTFRRRLAELNTGRATSGPTKYELSRDLGPKAPYGTFEVDRFGAVILVDSTPSNLWIIDERTLEAFQPELVLAQEALTRSIVGFRFVSSRPTMTDAVSLLRDIVMPKRRDPSWPEDTRWAYAGVPEKLVVVGEEPPEEIAAVPVVQPELLLTDNAWIYGSRAFREAAQLLGIDVEFARALTPTDKAMIEKAFSTIDRNFFALYRGAGYKGRDVHSGAKNAAAKAVLFLHELEALFREWIVRYWQRRHHQGLMFPHAPHLKLSPNDVYEAALQRDGFLSVPISRDLYYGLLPRKVVKVTREGIKIDHLVYDSEDLDPDFRFKKSPWAAFGHKWPVRYDQRDVTEVYIQNPNTNEWLIIPWRLRHRLKRPFDSSTRDLAIGFARQATPPRQQVKDRDVETFLIDLLHRRDALLLTRPDELKVARQAQTKERQAAEDRPHSADEASDGNGRSQESVPDSEDAPMFVPLDQLQRLKTLSDDPSTTNGKEPRDA